MRVPAAQVVARAAAAVAVGAQRAGWQFALLAALGACASVPAPAPSLPSAPRLPSASLAAPAASTSVAPLASPSRGVALTPFSAAAEGAQLPGQWEPYLLGPSKKPTHWRVARTQAAHALEDPVSAPRGPLQTVGAAHAEPALPIARVEVAPAQAVAPPPLALVGDADRSASGVAHPIGRHLRAGERLRWSWRIDLAPRDPDPGDRTREDSAMRVALSFHGDRSKMPARDLMLSELAQVITGKEIPYATLVYVWAPERELGEIVIDPRTSRVRSIVVANQATPLRTWLRSERDVAADFAAAFGEAPAHLHGIALFVDADHTDSRAIGWYGDLELD